jgi:exopolyphosphatase / guanosine-5'-triphosphate,3'-diphosphate pyrophosphatase
MTRVAAVDLGTNSTRLLVADVEDGQVEELARETVITRLGEGVDERHRLLPVPITRTRNCLTDFRRRIEELGAERTLLVATSAVRDAENGEAFLGEIEWSYGFATRLLSGNEEAQLTFAGVQVGLDLEDETLITDIGGGSTELIAGNREGLRSHVSLDLGCVRMTERYLRSDPPTRNELDACAAAVREHLRALPPPAVPPAAVVGVAGTATTIAAIDLKLVEYNSTLVHRHCVHRRSIDQQLERLAALPVADRRSVVGLEPQRAEVIVAGIVIARELLRHFALDKLEVSEFDLLAAAALLAAELPQATEGDAPPGAFTCC